MVGMGATRSAIRWPLLSRPLRSRHADAAGLSVLLLVPVGVGSDHIGATGRSLQTGETVG